MIEELKSLKDISEEYQIEKKKIIKSMMPNLSTEQKEVFFVLHPNYLKIDFISVSQIKNEAIKWVKELIKVCEKKSGGYIISIKNNYVGFNGKGKHESTAYNYCGRIRVLIDFFNITEEELK